MTIDFFAVRIASLSMVFFARISCAIPISVLIIMIHTKNAFLYEPTNSTSTRSTRFKKLKKVSVFSLTICLYVLVFGFSSALTLPCSIRSFTCSSVSPVNISPHNLSVCKNISRNISCRQWPQIYVSPSQPLFLSTLLLPRLR